MSSVHADTSLYTPERGVFCKLGDGPYKLYEVLEDGPGALSLLGMDRARVSVDKSRDVATTVDGITPVSIRAFVQEVLVQDTSVFYATAGTAPTVYTVRVVTDGYVSFVKLVKPDNSWFLSICVGGHYYIRPMVYGARVLDVILAAERRVHASARDVLHARDADDLIVGFCEDALRHILGTRHCDASLTRL